MRSLILLCFAISINPKVIVACSLKRGLENIILFAPLPKYARFGYKCQADIA
jgi:hypothetical protein